MKQIYGFTSPDTAETGYTGFLMAHAEPNGDVTVQIRQHEGQAAPKSFTLTADEAEKLARAIYRLRKDRKGKPGDAQD